MNGQDATELMNLYYGFGKYVTEHIQDGNCGDGLVAAWERLEDEISPTLRRKTGIDYIHAFVLQGYGTWDEIMADFPEFFADDVEDEV